MKKVITTITVIAMLLCLSPSVFAADISTGTIDVTLNPQVVGEINSQFYNLMDYFVAEDLCEEGTDYPAFYAGSYITAGYGKLVVCVTDDSAPIRDIIIEGTGNSDIEIEKVEYSYNELLEAKQQIQDQYIEIKKANNDEVQTASNVPEITSIGVSVKNNNIEVGVLNYNTGANITRSNATVSIASITDFPNITFVEGSYSEEQASYAPGDEINTTEGNSTMGHRGKVKASGASSYSKGFWMAGHAVANEGNSVNKANGTTYIGSCIARKHSGKIDAAFVALDNQTYDTVSNEVGDITLSDSSYVSSFAEDQVVYMYGAMSGLKEGYVVSTSYSFSIPGGISFSDFVKTNYRSVSGDSGAVIYVLSGSTYKAAGIHHGIVDTSYKAFCKIKNVYNEWDWNSWS